MRFLDDEFMENALESIIIERDYTKFIQDIEIYIAGLNMNENVKSYIAHVLNRSVYNPESYNNTFNNPAPYISAQMSLFISYMYYAVQQNHIVDDANEIIRILHEIEVRLYRFAVDENNLVLYKDNIVPFNRKEPEDN